MNNRQLKKRRIKRREHYENLSRDSLPTIEFLFGFNMYCDWHWPGCGFGQLDFKFDPETNQIHCGNECMSRDAVRKMLHSFADFVADRAILNSCWEEKEEDSIPLKPMPSPDEHGKHYIELTLDENNG